MVIMLQKIVDAKFLHFLDPFRHLDIYNGILLSKTKRDEKFADDDNKTAPNYIVQKKNTTFH